MDLFTSVRISRIKGIQGLTACEQHGKRLDESSQQRVNSSRTASNLKWSSYGDGLELLSNYKAMKAKTGAKEYGKAPIGMHIMCVVSPGLIAESGDIHNPKNPMNRKLMNNAIKWAKTEFGDAGIIGARLDVDENGCGVVDLFVSPVHTVVQRGKSKQVISVNKSLDALRKKHNQKFSYSALQDSWAEFAKVNLDGRLVRGKPKAVTQREHVHADVYRPAISQARRDAKRIIADAHREADAIKAKAVAELSAHPIAKVAKAITAGRKQAISEATAPYEQAITALKAEVTREAEKLEREQANHRETKFKREQTEQGWRDADRRAQGFEQVAELLAHKLIDISQQANMDPKQVIGDLMHTKDAADYLVDFLREILRHMFEMLAGSRQSFERT